MRGKMSSSPLSDQIDQIVKENQHLRVKSDNDDKTFHLLKAQYDELATSIEGVHELHAKEMHKLRTERDVAIRRFKEIDTLLMQCSDILMSALKARNGKYSMSPFQEEMNLSSNEEQQQLTHMS